MSRLLPCLLPLGLLACAAPSAAPQPEGASPAADPRAGLDERLGASLPGRDLERLASLLGSWEVVLERFEPGAGEPTLLGRGEAEIRAVLGGRFLAWETRFASPPLASRALLGFDGAERRYELSWVSELSSAQRLARGRGDPERGGIDLEWSERDPESGGVLRVRSTLRIQDPDRFQLVQRALDAESGEWIPLARRLYTRRAPAR